MSKTKSPFFSVIIPTFNRAHTLERAIKSVLAQSFQDFELLVVDDGSRDNTQKLLANYSGKIQSFYQDNRGVSFSRNRAAQQAKGQWICFLDSDDEWLSHKLEKQYQLILNSQYLAIHGEELWVRNGKRVNPKSIHKKGGGDQFIPSLKLCLISPSTVAIEKNTFFELGGFREDYEVCEDYDLWLKLTSLYEIGFIETALIIKYGGHPDQLSQKFKAMDWWRLRSLLWIYQNRELDKLKKEALITEAKNKAQVLELGHKKRGHHHKLQELNSLMEKFI